jgi:hypothetical protein
MTRQNVAMFVCRGMAIYIFFQSLFLLEIVAAGGRQLAMDWGQANKMPESVAIFLSSFVPFAGAAGFAILLWVRAARIGRRMVRGMDGESAEDRIQLDQRRTEAVILFGLGVYALARSMPQAGMVTSQYIISYINMDETMGEYARIGLVPPVVQAALQTAMGVLLLTAAWLRGGRGKP